MSGVIGDNVFRASGVIAEAAGGISWQAVETGSTLTAVAGNGYPIDTTSNACTITLPASANNGDKIIFTDYARYWGTNSITLDSNGLNYQGDDDTFTVEYTTDGQTVRIVYSGATNGWIPTLDDAVSDVPSKANDNGIFGYGSSPLVSMTNLVSNVGVVATDVTGVGTARSGLAACEYGEDKGIFGFGYTTGNQNVTNLVSNVGVVSTDVTGVGTGREALAACSYGGDKGIFGFGGAPTTAITNLVSNVGVVSTDVAGVGTARTGGIAACEYGDDKGIFGYGSGYSAVTNLVSNAGVVATDTTGVGTARGTLAACGYGGDKGIFGYGYTGSYVSMTNLVSSTGVVATDVTGVGTDRNGLGATQYGQDKGIFGYGYTGSTRLSLTNLVSNAGVVGTDVTGVGTARSEMAACSYN